MDLKQIAIILIIVASFVAYSEWKDSRYQSQLFDKMHQDQKSLVDTIKTLTASIASKDSSAKNITKRIETIKTNSVEKYYFILSVESADSLLAQLDTVRTKLGWDPKLFK